jgi:uncharacterized SAM-binding protein YcdF (DUF218 family)
MQDFLFTLSKLVRPFLVSPLFLSIFFSLIALSLLPAEKTVKKILKYTALFFCVSVAILAMQSTTSILAGLWEVPLGTLESLKAGETTNPNSQKSENKVDAQPFDAIVVLGGSINAAASDDKGRIQTNDSDERIIAAVRLYQAKVAPKILVSGGSGNPAWPDKKEAPLMADLLETMGVPRNAVIIENSSRNTYENATLSKPLLDGVGAKRIVLVTSAWHMRRSAAIFRKQGYDFASFPVDSLKEPFTPPADLAPDAGALDRSTRILREIVGIVAYKFLGRL